MLIVLESTTYLGTTEDLLKPILESTGLKCGEDFYLAFSPEPGLSISTLTPHVGEFQKNSLSKQREPELTAELLEAMDMVIVTAAHSTVDYELVQRHARHVFDTKNAMKDL